MFGTVSLLFKFETYKPLPNPCTSSDTIREIFLRQLQSYESELGVLLPSLITKIQKFYSLAFDCYQSCLRRIELLRKRNSAISTEIDSQIFLFSKTIPNNLNTSEQWIMNNATHIFSKITTLKCTLQNPSNVDFIFEAGLIKDALENYQKSSTSILNTLEREFFIII